LKVTAALAVSIVSSAQLVHAATDYSEPSDNTVHNTKVLADQFGSFTMSSGGGDTINGYTTGTSTAASPNPADSAADWYKVTTTAPRANLMPSFGTLGHKPIVTNKLAFTGNSNLYTGQVQAMSQTSAGVPIAGSTRQVGVSSATFNNIGSRYQNQFVSFGDSDKSLYYSVVKTSFQTTTSSTPYAVTYTRTVKDWANVQDIGTFDQGAFRIYDPTSIPTGGLTNNPYQGSNITYQVAPPMVQGSDGTYTGYLNYTLQGGVSPAPRLNRRVIPINTMVCIYNADTGELVRSINGIWGKSDTSSFAGTPQGFDLNNFVLTPGSYYVMVGEGNSRLVDGYGGPLDLGVNVSNVPVLDTQGLIVSNMSAPDFNIAFTYAAGQTDFTAAPPISSASSPGVSLGFVFRDPSGVDQIIRSVDTQQAQDLFVARFQVIPEPSALGLLAALVPVTMRRRK
jgi:hypothetical protein